MKTFNFDGETFASPLNPPRLQTEFPWLFSINNTSDVYLCCARTTDNSGSSVSSTRTHESRTNWFAPTIRYLDMSISWRRYVNKSSGTFPLDCESMYYNTISRFFFFQFLSRWYVYSYKLLVLRIVKAKTTSTWQTFISQCKSPRGLFNVTADSINIIDILILF